MKEDMFLTEKLMIRIHEKFRKGEIPFLYFRQEAPAHVIPFGSIPVLSECHSMNIKYENEIQAFNETVKYLAKLQDKYGNGIVFGIRSIVVDNNNDLVINYSITKIDFLTYKIKINKENDANT